MPALCFGDYVAGTLIGTTQAGVVAPFDHGKAIVEAEFGALLDIPFGNDPDLPTKDTRLAVRSAGVVDQAGQICGSAAIDVVPLVEREEKDAGWPAFGVGLQAPEFSTPRLCLGDSLTLILNDPDPCRDGSAGVEALAMDLRIPCGYPGRLGCARHSCRFRWSIFASRAKCVLVSWSEQVRILEGHYHTSADFARYSAISLG